DRAREDLDAAREERDGERLTRVGAVNLTVELDGHGSAAELRGNSSVQQHRDSRWRRLLASRVRVDLARTLSYSFPGLNLAPPESEGLEGWERRRDLVRTADSKCW